MIPTSESSQGNTRSDLTRWEASLGKNPLLFPFSWCKSITGSSSSSSSSGGGGSVCIACKWMRQYLHFIPHARVCICAYAHTCTLIYLFGCFAIWTCLCVPVRAQAFNWLWDQVFSCWFRLCWEFTRTWRGKREEKKQINAAAVGKINECLLSTPHRNHLPGPEWRILGQAFSLFGFGRSESELMTKKRKTHPKKSMRMILMVKPSLFAAKRGWRQSFK